MDSTVASYAQTSIPAFQMIGKKASLEKFSILLVGPSYLNKPLEAGIMKMNSEQDNYQMSVHCSELVEDIVKSSQMCHADFIAFLLDPKDPSCIESVERSICILEPLYMCSKLCLINCNPVDPLQSFDPEQIFNLVDKFSILLLNGNVQVEAENKFLSKRVLYLACSVCGVQTGRPLVFDLPCSKIIP